MNHRYRLIWSHLAHSLVPVAENARGQGKASGRVSTVVTGASVRTTFPLQCMALALATAFSGSVYALPAGEQIASGTATINRPTASSMTVQQSSQNLAINWQSFGIATGEAVQFNQPLASSIVLNRVLGQDPSKILGSLSANGQVFISNPNGILFAAGAQVNVGGLVATSLAISDADFAAGNYSFSKNGSAGAVTNQGSLMAAEGGYIALLAPEVRNEGTITAKLGKALLAAGNQVTLTLNNGSLIGYNIDQGAVNALADNRHLIKADGGQGILSARAADAVARSVVNNEGVIEAHTIDNQGGVIRLVGDEVRHGGKLDASAPGGGKGGTVQVEADLLVQTGSIDANGADGGNVTVNARRMLQSGNLMANGSAGAGGKVNLNMAQRLIQTEGVSVEADGRTAGGEIDVRAGTRVFSSASFSATGSDGNGGTIRLLANDLRLYGARLDASGATGGGTILVGGDTQGKNPAIPNARSASVNFSTSIKADATGSGHGGKVIVRSNGTTEFFGRITARGGATAGDGGGVEVAGDATLTFGGMVDAGASNGTAGHLLVSTKNITMDARPGGVSAYEMVDPNPDDGNQFGALVTVLAGDKVVVTHPDDDFMASNAGAVYVFNAKTGGLLNTLIGSTVNDRIGSAGIVALSSGNYLIKSPNWSNGAASNAGAVTWIPGATGLTGVVSAANSLVGSTTGDSIGSNVMLLPNGHYLVTAPTWRNNTGAVTWGNQTTGVRGPVSATNSLVGSTPGDLVGGGVDPGEQAIVILANGHYVVRSPKWANGSAAGAGAVTWGNKDSGVSGEVSAADNSLLGSTAGDEVGKRLTLLRNGHYVVVSPNWTNPKYAGAANAGAVTWRAGTNKGVVGAVSETNSLVGRTLNDRVGNEGIFLLADQKVNGVVTEYGNYLVRSLGWDNGAAVDAGAVTWGSSAGGVVGEVALSNSIVGHSSNDQVGSGGIGILANGNYVVSSPLWNNGAATDAGAVTWGSKNGTSGVVNETTSLVGTKSHDRVGATGIFALSDGNYVVSSSYWSNGTKSEAGAVTWADGSKATTDIVSGTNSLIGGNAYDWVGLGGITEVGNGGNYVVNSYLWGNNTGGSDNIPDWTPQYASGFGAVTWVAGKNGVKGPVTAENSLTGETPWDNVGSGGVHKLPNGNYVVLSPYWANTRTYENAQLNAGAATWGSGNSGGPTGLVSHENSLVGQWGANTRGIVLTILPSGNYLVNFPHWTYYDPAESNSWALSAGAVTFGNADTGVKGNISKDISLVGSHNMDQIGSEIIILANGNYVINSRNWGLYGGEIWEEGWGTIPLGAVTWGDGTGTKKLTGVVSEQNSLVGTRNTDGVSPIGREVIALPNGNYIVNSPEAGSYYEGGGESYGALGAVTWADGTKGIAGATWSTAWTANTMTGSYLGDDLGSSGITVLPDGNFVVRSPNWDAGWMPSAPKDLGAVTWGSGTTGWGPLGSGAWAHEVSGSNSIVGSVPNERVGAEPVSMLANGNVLVRTGGGLKVLVAGHNRVAPASTLRAASMTTLAAAEEIPVPGVRPAAGVMMAPATLAAITDTGTLVRLSAHNDITLAKNSNLVTSNAKGAGHLTLQAGRSIVLNSSITTGNGDLRLLANTSSGNGVRDAGAAVIRMASGTTLNVGTGNIEMRIGDGAGQTNATSGSITFDNLNAAHVLVKNDGATAGSGIQRVQASSTITANSVALDISNPNNTSGTIGLIISQLTIAANRLAARTRGGQIALSSAKAYDIGAATLGGLAGIHAAGGTVSLRHATGTLTQSAAITSGALNLLGTGDYLLTNSANAISRLAGSTGSVRLTNSKSLTVGTVVGTNGLTSSRTVALTTTGADADLTIDRAIVAAGSGEAVALKAGRSMLVNANISANNGSLSLAANERTVDGVADAGAAQITMASGTSLTASKGNIEIRMNDGDASAPAASGAITLDNVTATHVLVRNDGATDGSGIRRVRDASRINATSVALDVSNAGNTTGAIGTAAARMNVATSRLAARTRGGHLFLNSANAYEIGAATLGGIAGINAASGNVSLRHVTGTMTQSAGISSGGLELLGTGSYLLTHGANAITTLAGNTGSVRLLNTRSLAVGTVNTEGLTSSGTVALEATGADADLTLDRAIVATGSGNAVVLKAGSSNPAGVGSGGQFINNVGAKGIAARSGRYLVYSGAPRSTKPGMTGYSERSNTNASYTPDGTANMFLYRDGPQAGTLPGGLHPGTLPGESPLDNSPPGPSPGSIPGGTQPGSSPDGAQAGNAPGGWQPGTSPDGMQRGNAPGESQPEVPACSSGAEPDLSASRQDGVRGQNSCGSVTSPDSKSP